MAAKLPRFQDVASQWPLVVTAIFCCYAYLLLANAYRSHEQLRAEADQLIVADSKRRAAAVADLIAERRNGTVELAGAQEIASYLINRSLGMSLRYGLNANLYEIEERFRRQLEGVDLRGERIYRRIVLFDRSDQVLVDVAPGDLKAEPLPPASRGNSLVIDLASGQIIVSAPVVYKGTANGTLSTVGDIRQVSRDLIAADAKGARREFLVDADGRELPATGNPVLLDGNLVKELARLPENILTPTAQFADEKVEAPGRLALRTPVPGAALSLITILSEESVYGQITSRFFLYSASLFPIIVLFAAFMFERARRSRAALAESQQRFRTIFDNMRDGIFIQDLAAGTLVEANPRLLAMYGYDSDEIIGLTVGALSENVPPYSTTEWSSAVGRAVRGEPQFFAWHARRKDGELFWVEISMLQMAIDGQDKLLVVTHDMTQRKLQEQELVAALTYQRQLNRRLEEAQSQLLQSEKMASIGQLAAGVAHEINNPVGFVASNLNSLQAYVANLLELIAAYEHVEATISNPAVALEKTHALRAAMDIAFLKSDIRSLCTESSEGLERVIKIIRDLKDFSHVDRDETWTEEDLHKGIESTLNVIWNELKYKCDIRREYGALPPVQCLIFQLNQVFMNLLSNAAQAIETKGVITIRTGVVGDNVWIEVIDNGKGISDANLSKIFDPFFTTKPVGKGTGLGLSVSYNIVIAHHGTLDVTSREGQGTTFRVTLPIRQPVAAVKNTTSA